MLNYSNSSFVRPSPNTLSHRREQYWLKNGVSASHLNDINISTNNCFFTHIDSNIRGCRPAFHLGV